jgi:hypothetical protein
MTVSFENHRKYLKSTITCLCLVFITMVITIGAGLFIPFTHAQLSTNSNTTIQWTTYKNDKLGISFEYPSTWTLKEKTGRFDTSPDVLVSNDKDKPFQAFKVINHLKGLDSGLKTLGLEFVANFFKSTTLKEPGSRLIEDVSTNTFKIAGLPTADYLLATSLLGTDIGRQVFVVNNHGKAFILGYDNNQQDFDSPESQNTLNHILNSFKFT